MAQTSALSQTYSTLQQTVVNGNTEALQTAVNHSSGRGSFVLISGLMLLMMIASILETGTFFGFLLPSDLILSASIIVFVGTGKWIMILFITLISIVFTVFGDILGYMTGKRLGSGLYDRPDTWYFKKKYFLEAQQAFVTNGDKIMYIGRFLSVGSFLPMIAGVMVMERNKFLRLSLGSSILRNLSLVVPMTLLMALFPSIKYHLGILLIIIFTLPEIVGWIILLRPKAQEYATRLMNAKAQIDAIRQDISHIGSQMHSIIQTVTTDPHASTEPSAVVAESASVTPTAPAVSQEVVSPDVPVSPVSSQPNMSQ